MLDLRQLVVLRAVARTGSIAAAGRDLHYSQPTIAHHLRALESHLGTPLLERTARGSRLTDLGRLFLDHAEAVLDRLAGAEVEVRALARHGVVTLRIGTFPTAGASVLPLAVAETMRRSGVRVELLEAEPPVLLDRLRTRELHAALVYAETDRPLELDDDWTALHLFDDPFLLVLPADHPKAQGDPDAPVPLRALSEDGWVLSYEHEDEPGDQALHSAAAAAGFTPRPVLRTADYDVAFGFVAAGVGLALVPRMALVARPGIVVRRLDGPPLRRAVLLVRFAGAGPAAVDVLEEALRRSPLRGPLDVSAPAAGS